VDRWRVAQSARRLLWLRVTTSFAWHRMWPVPAGLSMRQVYAWIVDEEARALLIDMPGGWNLPGGTPEPHDGGWETTLRREVLEEADVTVRVVVPFGYQEVCADGGEPFAQLRVAARTPGPPGTGARAPSAFFGDHLHRTGPHRRQSQSGVTGRHHHPDLPRIVQPGIHVPRRREFRQWHAVHSGYGWGCATACLQSRLSECKHYQA
jgi:8-oxo-dGTP pyrophosphatase MutT (NUDIX family)